MPLIRKFAVQGHAVPHGYQSARGPFPPEIFASNPRAEEEQYNSDSLHEALDDIRLFRCKYCGDILEEDELDSHICEDEEE
jgi:hypothetical protein